MRLTRIKLAGFKSFVDPTDLKLPSRLVGVVGPNGCGKSNTIDAVRWVMGESSAKHLRGESMDDVIFTGSSSRKPVSMASVELVFDNADGSLGGEYADYAEISIRREVTRDGQSKYLLNNVRCRRRDIRDIFLGTGLGPRSYAIIEQGMISRLIEAKPEELRVYLEEAAGISKYKERRRETENRIGHTRDNLARLDDLREELDKQLEKLKRQSSAAERYQVLKADERRVRGELLVLRRREFEGQRDAQGRVIGERETALEGIVAELRASETALERARLQQGEATETLSVVQAEFYRVGAEVTRLEQSIEHTRDTRRQRSRELEEVERTLGEARVHLADDARRVAEIDEAMASDEPAFEMLAETQRLSAETLARAETELGEWQARQDAFAARNAEATQTAQVERSRIEQLERSIAAASSRLERLEGERATLVDTPHARAIDELAEEERDAAAEETRLGAALAESVATRERLRGERRELDERRNERRARSQSLLGRLASLEALQQAALAADRGDDSGWIGANGLDERPRLAQTIRADAGWEPAVELVLGPRLEAICVADDTLFDRCLASPPDARFTLVHDGGSDHAGSDHGGSDHDGSDHDGSDHDGSDHGGSDHGGRTTPDPAADGARTTGGPRPAPLAAKVHGPAALGGWLNGVLAADTLEDALACRPSLRPGESVVTPEGLWFGPGWLRVARAAAEDGVLARETALVEVRDELAALDEALAELDEQVEDAARRESEHDTRRETLQHAVNDAVRALAKVRSTLAAERQKLEQSETRARRLDEELGELHGGLEGDRGTLEQASERRAEALAGLEELERERDALRTEHEALRANVVEARVRSEGDRSAGQELAIRVESMRGVRATTEQNLSRLHARIEQLEVRETDLNAMLASGEGDDPLVALEAALQRTLAAKLAADASFGNARAALGEVDARLGEHERARQLHERRAAELRETLQESRMASQEVLVRLKTIDEQLAEHDHDAEALLAALDPEATIDAHTAELESLERRISRLGPINLAAIDEHAEQLERKEHLDAQHADIVEALETLERAIAKIDRETRARFKDTYDKVDARFQEFFPRLFGGGAASLEMTGDDLLTTGIGVSAQPPGKRVNNIQLLSGGEKALTAVALVFAFFELNPSPFCMLDEVDAPLDDANVGRFCALVREMSERVQFIFITHNKVTMELAEQLMGVTMNEPGVSRLVAVDVQEAVELAGV